MAPLAKNGGPQKKSWTAVAIAALFVMGFLAAVAFGDTGGGATTSGSTDTATASSSAPTDTGTTATTSTDTTPTDTTPTDTTPTSTSTTTTTTPGSIFSPTISSDRADYTPGSTVTLTGAGWGPGEAVHIFVNDSVGQTWSYSTDVAADATGAFTNQFQLPTSFVAVYTASATGAGGEMATTTFTDGNVDYAPSRVPSAGFQTVNVGNNFDFAATLSKQGGGADPQVNLPFLVSNPTSGNASNQACGGAQQTIPTSWLSVVTPSLPATISSSTSFTLRATPSAGSSGLYTGFVMLSTPVGGNAGSIALCISVPSVQNTSTVVATSGTPSTYGSSVTLSATISPSPGGGTVTFNDGASPICSNVAVSTNTASCATSTLSAGSHSITAVYSGTSGFNGSTSTPLTQVVNQKQLTGSFTANSKVYDRTTAATIATRSLTGVVGTDNVTLTGGTATFSDKNVGTGKTVTGTGFTLSGTAAGNYTLASSTLTTTANITAKSVTGSFTAPNKVYDGNDSATVTAPSLTGLIAGDTVTLTGGTATFVDKNVGSGKIVTGTGFSLGGADATNYALASSTLTTNADITPKSVTGSFTAANKTYDATNAATINGRSLTAAIGSDDVSLTGGTATFANKSVGTGKTVTGTGFSLGGADATNYSLASSTLTTTADITARNLTVSATADNKQYDGTTAATAHLSTNALAGDTVNAANTSAAFSDKNVGNAKTVNVTGISISGADAGNYNLTNTSATATANITARDLTVSATADNKQYDGTTAATAHLSTNALAGDTVNAAYTSAAFADKNVGNAKTVNVTGISISGADAGNYNLTNTSATATANITARNLTVSSTADNKAYDGTTAATAHLSTDKASGDDVTATYASASFATKNVGTGKTVDVSGISIGGADAGNYSLTNTSATATADITARNLTVTAHGANKIYDGTTAATVTLSTDKVSGDDVTPNYSSASFDTKNAGTGKTVNVSGISISGADAGNYNLTNTTTSTTADISARDLTVSATGVNKVYDATTAATVTLSTDKVSGDDVTAAYSSASFADKNVGNGKSVSVSGISISGADAGNYNLTNTTATTTANITKRDLTVSATGVNKVYDGTATATVTLSANQLGGDDVTASYGSATFADKNVGSGKLVSVNGISISGADAGNYNLLNSTASTTADITARDLTVTASGVNKVYDATTSATVTLSTDKVSGDAVTPAYTSASFNNKNVGTGKPVSVSGVSISGADATNYNLTNTTASTTADITARNLTVSATGANKIYDGTTAATVTLSTNKISGDDVTANYSSASFNNKNVGTGKPVSVSGISISGGDAGNYNLTNTTASTTADITKADLHVSATGVNKVYDGTADATVNLSSDKVSTDTVNLAYTSASFDNKNVGTSKPVSVSGISISGADAGNYNLINTTASTTADITKRDLTVSASGVNNVYDATAVATVTLSTDKVSGDDVTPAYTSASFNNKNVGTGKPVSVSGISISGADATNYNLTNTTASTTADITKRDLTVTATGVDKVYDGTTAATVTLSTNHLGGDDVTASYGSATFADKNVGSGKLVSVSGISISGADAGNYNLLNTTASTTADITARNLTVSANGVNKVYDATTDATATLSTDKVSGDDVTPAYTSASFNNKNVGTGKPVSVSGISISGADVTNYNLTNTTASTTGDITKRDLTVSATGVNKVYDAATTATVTLSSNELGGDDVTPAYTSASFNNKNVGTAKPVSVNGISIGGTDAGNYNLTNTTASTTADITARNLTVSVTGVNKVYDGNATATVNLSSDKIGSDAVTLAYANASFNNKNVGTGKPVSVSGISISGADAGNYNLTNTTASTSADITARNLTVSATGVNKVYDGTADATVNLSTDKVSGDDVTAAYTSASFNNKNVGTSKPVSVSGISISGTDSGNYNLTNTTTATTANITARDLTVTAHGANKIYDATTAATVTLSTDKFAGDSVTAAYSAASFADKNVGTGKTVSVSGISISGTDAGNYHLTNTTASTTADITKANLTVSATGVNKVYDGNATATANMGSDKIGSDAVTLAYASASFNNKNVGTGKTVSVSGISISGADAGNYNLTNTTASTTANMTALGITGSFTAANKVFDGNTAATVLSRSVNGAVAGDDVSLTGGTATFNNANVGANKTVTLTGATLSGADAGNYTLTSVNTTTASITAWTALGDGFYPPVGVANSVFVAAPGAAPAPDANTIWNTAKGGSTIPLKFNVYAGTVEQTTLAAISAFTQQNIACATGAGDDPVDITTTGNTTLRYDTGQWIQNWKTPSASTDKCYRATVTFADGSSLSAFFKLKK